MPTARLAIMADDTNYGSLGALAPNWSDGERNIDPDEIYGGCYVFAALGAYPYDMMGNRGVSFGLDGIQKVADGDPFDGRSRAEDVFGVLDDDDDDEDFGI